MKKLMTVLAMLLIFSPQADACVGKVLHVGALNSPEGRVLGEMLSSLINERTGSTVEIQLYRDEQELYAAMQTQQVDISIDNTSRALIVLNMPAEKNAEKAYAAVKTVFEKERGLVWLKPFGFQSSGQTPSYTAAVLRVDVINNFPALPRVIGKLGNSLNDEAYAKLIKSVESGETPKKAARDFLKSKKLI
jgi:osmoprotectant transport system substrate-binding protein